MDPEPLATYLREIAGAPILSAQQEEELAGRAAAGGRDGQTARRELLEANLRLVVAVARGYEGSGVPLLDIIQEGNIGLMRALERYDPGHRVKFSTFAAGLIREAISTGLEGRAGEGS
jgi:DNA-directed RNA polymerase sigma subunit (sigma70/sigma32)